MNSQTLILAHMSAKHRHHGSPSLLPLPPPLPQARTSSHATIAAPMLAQSQPSSEGHTCTPSPRDGDLSRSVVCASFSSICRAARPVKIVPRPARAGQNETRSKRG